MNPTLSLTKDPIPSLIKKIAIPASVGTFFQTMFNIVDTFFAGKISPEALSALAKSFPIYFIIIAAVSYTHLRAHETPASRMASCA